MKQFRLLKLVRFGHNRKLEIMYDAENPPQVAVDNGHALEWDPPAALTSTKRWTCTRRDCGMAVLESDGSVRGSAAQEPCGGRGSS